MKKNYFFLVFFCFGFTAKAQIQTGVFRTPSGNTDYHQFTRNGTGATVYINQVDNVQPILTLSSGTATAGENVRFTVKNSGAVGIGTGNPSEKLHIMGNALAQGALISVNPDNSGARVSLDWLDNVARIRIGGSDEGATNGFDIQGTGNKSLMRLLNNGYVGIGTTTPQEKLSVNGNIRAKQIKVETANWPDYVFQKNYSNMPLPELSNYIAQHHHLPGIPSAAEVEKDGISLGEMNSKLLEKIEELTLHLIRQQEELLAIKTELAELKGNNQAPKKSNTD